MPFPDVKVVKVKMRSAAMTGRVGVLFAAGIEEAGYNSPTIYRPTKAREELACEATNESEKSAPTRPVC